MKNTLLYTVITLAAFSSCKQDNNGQDGKDNQDRTTVVSTQIPAGTELWAEQVESQTDMLRPGDWPEEDWNTTYKNVNNEKIFNTIRDYVLNGELQAYNYLFDTVKISPQEIRNMLSVTDTIYGQDENTGEMSVKDVKKGISSKDISSIKVKEKWLFDPKGKKLYKDVTDIAFFVNSYSGDGSIRGQRALFYVKLGTGGSPGAKP
jgi:hypothetical protein